MFLAADIGGTKTLLALGDSQGVSLRRRYDNDAFADPQALIAQFLSDARAAGAVAPLRATCLALAGPVANGASRARLTNRAWAVDATTLSSHLPLGPVSLLNDFAASAAGIATLTDGEFVTLQAGEADSGALRLALGPGTGLGVAACLPLATRQEIILASEGGHVGIAPADAEQQGLLDFLRLRHSHARHVSVERIVSGTGLRDCYDYCVGAAPLESGPLSPAEVSSRALAASDPYCVLALDLFLAVFGSFAGDMALSFLAQGGVYLLGGIVPKVLPRLVSGPFLAAFNDKAEYRTLATAMPVHAVLAEDMALRGALARASASLG